MCIVACTKFASPVKISTVLQVTAGVFHKVFHQVFLQLLFILSWKLALRGHFKISKKKKNNFMFQLDTDCVSGRHVV